ncbi:MAG: hypothetical protein OEZ29_04140 [Candidatus Bathyarchaeota archaeon]|nr:hypothetical protein [Candidatus Bathyarchaeota archaeon]MDH5779766.1 hypothetical protein [Candidatus Bathyarchaeota archaeon]
MRGEAASLLTRQGLMKARTRAVRQRIWFKALSKVERGIVDLTIRCIERVRSRILNRIVSNIIAKILKNLKPSFLETVTKVGREIAHEICEIALKWGNLRASSWRHDSDFIQFLGVTAINR